MRTAFSGITHNVGYMQTKNSSQFLIIPGCFYKNVVMVKLSK